MTLQDGGPNGASWGASRMNAFETIMWRGEVDPRLRSTGTILMKLDIVPDWDRLLAAHERATRLVPRLRERVVEPLLPLAAPGWAQDTHFDLRYHVRRVAVPSPGESRQMLDVVGSFAQTPLDRSRPQWEGLLVEGLDGGGAVYVFKFHHSLTDGQGFIQLLSMTLSDTRTRRDEEPVPASRDGHHETPIGLLGHGLVSSATGVATSALRSVRRAGEALRDPLGAFSEGREYFGSLKRVLAPSGMRRSPLLTSGSSLGWCFVAHELPFVDLRASAKVVGGSLNDAFVAAVLGALRRYHEALGAPVDEIPLGMPVSLRTENDPLGGNKFASAKFAAPIGVRDPAERIRRVRELVLDARGESAITAIEAISPVMSRLPTAVIVRLTSAFAGTLDIQASNVPGLTRSAYIAGAKVTHIYPFGPLPGSALMVALMSHEGNCCIGVNVDPESITDVALFERCLQEGFDEVLALAPSRANARARTNKGATR